MPKSSMVALCVVLAACGGAGGGEVTTSTSTVPSTTTTVAETTTTTVAQTTTTIVLTTTTTVGGLGLGEAETDTQAAALAILYFSLLRESLIEIIGGLSDVESVDKVAIDVRDSSDPEAVLEAVFEVDVTSAWSSAENQAEGAWTITRVLAGLWDEEEGSFFSELWMPPLRLTNSRTVYECSGEFMAKLAATLAGRSDWEAECAS